MVKIYFDWNIFSNIKNRDSLVEERDALTFRTLVELINALSGKVTIPYSNAHLNDLHKSYIKGHVSKVLESLSFISQISKNICLAQYWNENSAIWHIRHPQEFFFDILENDGDINYSSLDTIFEPLRELGLSSLIDEFKNIPLDIDFNQIDNFNTGLSLIFRKSRVQNNLYAFMEDLISIFNELKSNPTIYNQLKKSFKDFIPLNGAVHNSNEVIKLLDDTLPKTMLNKSFTQLYEESNTSKTSMNDLYSKITGVFMQLDFIGYASDKLSEKNKYDNLFNDALHCFYASHCDYFITADNKMYKKCIAVYKNEGIYTNVMKPQEFIDFASNITDIR